MSILTRFSTIVIIVLMILIITNAPSNASFSINQQLIEVQARHGQERVGTITVRNHSDDVMNIKVIPVDYVRDSKGGVETPDAGMTQYSLFPYIDLSATYITLQPNSSYNLQYVITLPTEVEGSRWFALYFEPDIKPPLLDNIENNPEQANFHINVLISYRTLFLVTAQGTEQPGGAITAVRKIKGPSLGFEVDLRNTGNVYYRATGWVDIRNEQGETVATLPIKRSFVLPDQTLTIQVLGDGEENELDLPAGKYLALAVIDFGGDQLVAGQLRFNIE